MTGDGGIADAMCGGSHPVAAARRMKHAFDVRYARAALWLGVAAAAQVQSVAAAPPAKPSKPPPALWIGVFDPGLPVHAPWGYAKLTPVAHAGSVRVLSSDAGPPPAGDVVVVHPLLDKIATGKLDRGTVALAEFAYDQRDGDDGVLVLPAGTQVALVAPSKTDVTAIKATLIRTDTLAGVRRAVDGLELAGVDVDGDGQADAVTAYGCAAWFDGSCQSHGQFVLVRRGARWAIVE